jgi:nucleotide-binding universal stress UspA family protein
MLCEKVDDLQAALVVLSRRRRSFIEDLFSGPPISQQVAQACPRPTLILQDTTC